MAKFIFVTGGVVSSLGKGINASSIGRLLKNRGLKVFMQKFDPYINVDPGNMSPLQHGEVFVTDDGAETDLDLGHYERFIDENLSKYSSVTTGKVYLKVIDKERKGEYGGKTVQVVPHITDTIKEYCYKAAENSHADIIITELGGTVGDIEGLPFLEAIRQMRRDVGYNNTLYVHNTLVPYISASQELKTKPTQHSVKELQSLGISPDIIILRSERKIPQKDKEKIALFCNVNIEAVIEAIDCKYLYEIPLNLAKQHIDDYIVRHFGLEAAPLDMSEWTKMVENIKKAKKEVTITVVGKYPLQDAYLSIHEALKHAAWHHQASVKIEYIDAETVDIDNVEELLSKTDGILVPGGFGERAAIGKMVAIRYAREHKIPYFGICFGMQLSLIEYARNVLGYPEAGSTEFSENCKMPIIDLKFSKRGMENHMRLGLYDCHLALGTKIYGAYQVQDIRERHRHRFEFNNQYKKIYENTDMVFSGINLENDIVETIELKNHPWFVACQYHPEFLSRPNKPHPLFLGFIKTSLDIRETKSL